MGLIKCPECGKEISDLAKSCPNCGRPMNVWQETEALPKKQKKKKRGHGCLISFIIFILLLAGLGVAVSKGVDDMQKNPEKYDDSIAAKYIDVSSKESKKIDSVLNECGIESVESFEHDELLDGTHAEGETGYRLSVSSNVKNIILYLNKDKSVYSLSYNTHDLYAENAVVATMQDYTVSADEASDLMIWCEEKVKEVLKSPSTAKFPNIMKWGFGKEKNIVTVQGYVDAQNSFGAEMRSDFQFIIDTDSNAVQSFIFDGQELVKK